MSKKRVVVTGMGIVSCFGNDVDFFYDQLIQGKSGVSMITKFPCDFPTRFAASVPDFDPGEYVDKKQDRRIDPFIRYSIVAGKKALESAGLTLDAVQSCDKTKCGVIIGSGMGGMSTFYEGTRILDHKGYKRLSPFFVPYIITNMGGALLAIDYGFMGPNYSISTACATANYSIVAAANHIRRGEADVMVCGGSEAGVSPIGLAGFVANGALSERNDDPQGASRPWDQHRDGFVLGEGAGVLVLESLEHALERNAPILAEYLGGGFSCDAFHMTALKEDGSGIALCLKNALHDAGVLPEQIDYINAHATSTPKGDLVEVKAIRDMWGSHTKNLMMNATKSMTGHCLGAAGGIEAIATIKALQTGIIHPTINVHNPDPLLGDINIVAGVAQKKEITTALSNSFGFGGHNSAIILCKYPL
jgi:3-oxoacyl-[acyl-carrier-protein] synthase II